jgi:hypothetical protein
LCPKSILFEVINDWNLNFREHFSTLESRVAALFLCSTDVIALNTES